MANRQSVSSILKPPKVRAPLKEIETPVDEDGDENTESLPKRKVSFSGMNKIKMYNTGATSLTVNQAPLIDEQISVLSDSSNAEKTKLSGKFEKSDSQITFESTNCTNLENNGRVIIEYESPNDNMEMTEALSGPIFDTIHTFDHNTSENIDYCSDYSENNMEFTEAIKVGTILTADESHFESYNMSETLDNEHQEQSVTHFNLEPSTLLSNMSVKNTTNISSHQMNCTNLNSTTITSLKPILLNDNNMSMELTQLSNKHVYENIDDSDCEYSDNSINIDLKTNKDTNDPNGILHSCSSESNNYLNHQNNLIFKNADNDEKLSSSVVSMDVDLTSEGIIYVGIDGSEKNGTMVNDTILKNRISMKSLFSPDVSLVQELLPKSNLNESTTIKEQLQKNDLNVSTSVFKKNQPTSRDPSFLVDKNQQKTYSKKSIIPTSPSIFQEQFMDNSTYVNNKFQLIKNEKELDSSVMIEKNHHKRYSRKSVGPAAFYNETRLTEYDDTSDSSLMVGENVQEINTRKSIALGSIHSPTESAQEECIPSDTSAVVKEKNHRSYSRKSIVPLSVSKQTLCLEYDDLSDTSEENKLNSRKSKASESPINDVSFISGNSSVQLDELSNDEEKLMLRNEQSALNSTKIKDEFNSPFRKKSRITMGPVDFQKQYVKSLCSKNTEFTLNCKQNKSEIIIEHNHSVDSEVSKMDISAELVHNDNALNISSNNTDTATSFSVSNDSSKISNYSTKDQNILSSRNNYLRQKPNNCLSSIEKNSNILDVLQGEKLHGNIENYTLDKIGKENICMGPTVLEKSNSCSVELTEDNEMLNDNCISKDMNYSLQKIDNSLKTIVDGATDESYVEGLSDMSICDETLGNTNRKRSHSKRNYLPLPSSSFILKPNVLNSSNEDFLKESLIGNDFPEDSINKDFEMESSIEEDKNKENSTNEPLCNEVLEFLTRWNAKFVKNNLVLNKCTNSEWIFSMLDSNIILKVSYCPVSNNQSFLKVEDILISKTMTQNEITNFGINWILTKYNLKMYKHVCFTSRDVELLLKSLLEDIDYIIKVMKNLSYVRDVHCVTFVDNKAKFVLHSMNPLLMVSIEVFLTNIHKLSSKDFNVNCIFGTFNTQVLDETLENIIKDCKILQSLIEKLKNLIRLY